MLAETGASSSNLVFSADPTSDDEAGDDDGEVGLGDTSMAQTAQAEGEGDGEEGVDEPEDDYNAAWEVLDVARTIYATVVEGKKEGEGREERLCLAECYLALGDVSSETGKSFRLSMTSFADRVAQKTSLKRYKTTLPRWPSNPLSSLPPPAPSLPSTTNSPPSSNSRPTAGPTPSPTSSSPSPASARGAPSSPRRPTSALKWPN